MHVDAAHQAAVNELIERSRARASNQKAPLVPKPDTTKPVAHREFVMNPKAALKWGVPVMSEEAVKENRDMVNNKTTNGRAQAWRRKKGTPEVQRTRW